MVTRAQIVAEAREWSGTPVMHQGQRKGLACDCKGLVVGVAAELGMPEAQTLAARVRNYSKAFSGRDMLAGLQVSLERVETPEPGDVLAILFGRDPLPRHLAILTEPGRIVHAYFGFGRVAEVPLGKWRVHSAWTWRSLEAGHGC